MLTLPKNGMESDDIGYLGRSNDNDRRKYNESISDYYKRLSKSETYIRYSNDGLGPLFIDPNTGKGIYAE